MSDPSNTTSLFGPQDGQDAENTTNSRAEQTALILQNITAIPIAAPSARPDLPLYGIPGESRNLIYNALAFRYSADRSQLPSRYEQADIEWMQAHGWTLKTSHQFYKYRLWTRYLTFPPDNWFHGVLDLGSNSFGPEFLTYVSDNLHSNKNYWDVEVRAHAFDIPDPYAAPNFVSRTTLTYINVPPTFKNSPTWVRLNCELTCDQAVTPHTHLRRVASSFAYSIIDAALFLKHETDDGTTFRFPGYMQRAADAYMAARADGTPRPSLDVVVVMKVSTGNPALGEAPKIPTVIDLNRGNDNPWNLGTDALSRIIRTIQGSLRLWKCFVPVYIDGHFIPVDADGRSVFPPYMQPKPTYYNGYKLTLEVLIPDIEGMTLHHDPPSDSDGSLDFEPEASSSESDDAMQE